MNNQKKVFIIAEAGDNHNGDYDTALKLVDKAVEAGADCVKFQTFVTERVISKLAEKADYQKESTGTGESQYEMVKKLELSFEQFRQIKKYCEQKKIMFLSTPFDLESIDFLQEIDIPFWKIPSGEITNLPYLEKIAHTGKDIIMSTGMCTMEEIQKAIDILKKNGAGKITLLHCNTEYPTPYEDVNLRAMKTMAETFGVEVGYSDHTKGIVQSIRNIEKALGSSEKKPSASEIKNIDIARKSIVAKKTIKKGEELTEDNLDIKRPGNGISPMCWYDLLGTKAVKDFSEDELITR